MASIFSVLPQWPTPLKNFKAWAKEPNNKKKVTALKITLLAVGILAALGAAYALTGHFVGFGAMNQAIAHGLGTAAGGIKHFYTHLNVWKGVVGIGIPTLLVTSLGTLLVVKKCRTKNQSDYFPIMSGDYAASLLKGNAAAAFMFAMEGEE